jgi:hypothetical protein
VAHLQILPGVFDRVDPLVERFLDMREKLRWMLAVGGERVLLYKRKFSGTLSPYYDPVRRQLQQDPNDTIGFGTPFVGGYFGPFEIFVSLKTAGSQQQITIMDQGMKRTFNSVGSWALWEPLLNNKDFIVRRNNQRMWIESVDFSKWRHHILHQTFNATEVERSSLVYKIPIAGLADDRTGLTCPVVPPLP